MHRPFAMSRFIPEVTPPPRETIPIAMMQYWRPDTVIVPPLVTTCVVTLPDGSTSMRPLGDEMSIGRARDSDLYLHDDRVARLHARLRRTPRGLVVEDRNSDNGTWVVRRLIPGVPHLLHVGDTILVGGSRITFVHQLPPMAPPDDEVRRLIAAICETPDDDEPRMVLADLFTARGDPRGEFISYQIAAESSVNTGATDRADKLLLPNEIAWLAPMPIPIASWTFRRGFLDCIWVLPGQSVAELRDHHPLRAVVVIE